MDISTLTLTLRLKKVDIFEDETGSLVPRCLILEVDYESQLNKLLYTVYQKSHKTHLIKSVF